MKTYRIEDYRRFKPSPDGAYATCRVLQGQYDQANRQEWEERGTIDGIPVRVLYLFDNLEAEKEDGSDIPFDLDHVTGIEADWEAVQSRWKISGGQRRKDSLGWAGLSGWVADGDTWTDEEQARTAFAEAVADARQNCPAFDYVQLAVATPESFEMFTAVETVEVGEMQ